MEWERIWSTLCPMRHHTRVKRRSDRFIYLSLIPVNAIKATQKRGWTAISARRQLQFNSESFLHESHISWGHSTGEPHAKHLFLYSSGKSDALKSLQSLVLSASVMFASQKTLRQWGYILFEDQILINFSLQIFDVVRLSCQRKFRDPFLQRVSLVDSGERWMITVIMVLRVSSRS